MAYTYAYAQPTEYRFSLDSVLMAELVARRLRDQQSLSKLRVMDVCAGCGVIGFELSWHLRELRQFDFVEVQSLYLTYFAENLKIVDRPEVSWNFHPMNYEALCRPMWLESIDVVVCNPPYFQPGQGKLSPSEFKNRCRFYLDSDFKSLVESILWVLKPGAVGYLLLRTLEDHGWDLKSELELRCAGLATVTRVDNVRGTDLMEIKKL